MQHALWRVSPCLQPSCQQVDWVAQHGRQRQGQRAIQLIWDLQGGSPRGKQAEVGCWLQRQSTYCSWPQAKPWCMRACGGLGWAGLAWGSRGPMTGHRELLKLVAGLTNTMRSTRDGTSACTKCGGGQAGNRQQLGIRQHGKGMRHRRRQSAPISLGWQQDCLHASRRLDTSSHC